MAKMYATMRMPTHRACTFWSSWPLAGLVWNAVRVTRGRADKQPHDVAAVCDQVADRYDLT